MKRNQQEQLSRPEPEYVKHQISRLFAVEIPISFPTSSLEMREFGALLTGTGIALGYLSNLQKGLLYDTATNPKPLESAPMYNNVRDPENKVWGKDSIVALLKDLDNLQNPLNSPEERQA